MVCSTRDVDEMINQVSFKAYAMKVTKRAQSRTSFSISLHTPLWTGELLQCCLVNVAKRVIQQVERVEVQFLPDEEVPYYACKSVALYCSPSTAADNLFRLWRNKALPLNAVIFENKHCQSACQASCFSVPLYVQIHS